MDDEDNFILNAAYLIADGSSVNVDFSIPNETRTNNTKGEPYIYEIHLQVTNYSRIAYLLHCYIDDDQYININLDVIFRKYKKGSLFLIKAIIKYTLDQIDWMVLNIFYIYHIFSIIASYLNINPEISITSFQDNLFYSSPPVYLGERSIEFISFVYLFHKRLNIYRLYIPGTEIQNQTIDNLLISVNSLHIFHRDVKLNALVNKVRYQLIYTNIDDDIVRYTSEPNHYITHIDILSPNDDFREILINENGIIFTMWNETQLLEFTLSSIIKLDWVSTLQILINIWEYSLLKQKNIPMLPVLLTYMSILKIFEPYISELLDYN
jgi:hypothetical protein